MVPSTATGKRGWRTGEGGGGGVEGSGKGREPPPVKPWIGVSGCVQRGCPSVCPCWLINGDVRLFGDCAHVEQTLLYHSISVCLLGQMTPSLEVWQQNCKDVEDISCEGNPSLLVSLSGIVADSPLGLLL